MWFVLFIAGAVYGVVLGWLVSRFVVCMCCLFRFGLLLSVIWLLLCLFVGGLGRLEFRFRLC